LISRIDNGEVKQKPNSPQLLTQLTRRSAEKKIIIRASARQGCRAVVLSGGRRAHFDREVSKTQKKKGAGAPPVNRKLKKQKKKISREESKKITM